MILRTWGRFRAVVASSECLGRRIGSSPPVLALHSSCHEKHSDTARPRASSTRVLHFPSIDTSFRRRKTRTLSIIPLCHSAGIVTGVSENMSSKSCCCVMMKAVAWQYERYFWMQAQMDLDIPPVCPRKPVNVLTNPNSFATPLCLGCSELGGAMID